MLFRFSLTSRYFFRSVRGWFTPIFPYRSEVYEYWPVLTPKLYGEYRWFYTGICTPFFRSAICTLNSGRYANVYEGFTHASWLALTGHTAKIACMNISDEKQTRSAPTGIHMLSLEKENKMKNHWCAQEAVHMHFRFWKNSRYTRKNSSYTKLRKAKMYECCRLLLP